MGITLQTTKMIRMYGWLEVDDHHYNTAMITPHRINKHYA